MHNNYDKQVASWLIFVAAVIFFMIILGGATRLTHSGLSMVDWNPVMGAGGAISIIGGILFVIVMIKAFLKRERA